MTRPGCWPARSAAPRSWRRCWIPARSTTAIRNRYGGNALIPACERGHVETVRLLLDRSKIDVDHINNLGWTGSWRR